METSKRDGSSSKHKHKKQKNKKHKKKTRRSSSATSESEGSGMEWVEAPTPKATQNPKVIESSHNQREDWMNAELFVSTFSKDEIASGSSSREKKKVIEMQKKEKEEEIKQSRELNPHWKNSGSGLPEEGQVSAKDLRLPASSVGDGGYHYLRKAYLRIQEQAQDQGRSMEEVAVERWGSLSKLVSMIDEAEKRMKSHARGKHDSHRKERDRSPDRDRFRKPSGRSPSPERIQFQRPLDHDRSRRKVCNVSSSRDRKRNYYSPARSPSHEKDSPEPSERKTESRLHSEPYKPAIGASREEKRIPAWKKITPQEKRIPSSSYDDRTSPPPSATPSGDDGHRPSKQARAEPPSPPLITSEDDLNRLASRYFKADMMGDQALATKLKAELEEARAKFKAGKASGAPSTSSKQTERVLLTKMDSTGHQRPIQASREDAGFDRRSKKEQKKSNKYFDDSSRYSLKQMFEREKLTTAEDNIEMFLEVAAEAKDMNEENETSGISKKAMQKMAHGVQEEKDIGKAIRQHQKLSAALEKCSYCLDQPNMKRHLIVSISEEVYVSLPNYQSLCDGHCLIVPKRHVCSFLNLDEGEWNGVEEAKALLRRYFRSHEKSLICLETSMFFGRCPHAVLECIPVPEEEGDMAPLYFKKAILESEEEWAHNVKLVDLTSKGLRRSVPKNLPYFCVLFDPAVHAGYAHVIEDEKYFPRNFGKEVLGGMLDIDYNHLYKNRKDDPLKKSNEALEFTRSLEKFQEK